MATTLEGDTIVELVVLFTAKGDVTTPNRDEDGVEGSVEDEATEEIEGRSEGEGGVVRLSVGAVDGS